MSVAERLADTFNRAPSTAIDSSATPTAPQGLAKAPYGLQIEVLKQASSRVQKGEGSDIDRMLVDTMGRAGMQNAGMIWKGEDRRLESALGENMSGYIGINDYGFKGKRQYIADRRYLLDLYVVAYNNADVRTAITHQRNEIFRRGFDWVQKYDYRCPADDEEFTAIDARKMDYKHPHKVKNKQTGEVKEVEVPLEMPDEGQKIEFDKFIESCNYFGQSLETILRECVPGDTLIQTKQGYRPIREITKGTEVLTHLGNWRAVTETIEHSHEGPLVELRLFGGLPVKVTPNHPVWASRAEASVSRKAGARGRRYNPQPEWIPAGELKAGDVVWTTVRWGKRVGRKPDEFPEVTEFLTRPAVRLPGGQYKNPIEKWPLNSETLRLLGYYLAEGHATDTGDISFAFHKKEWAYQIDVVGLLRKYVGGSIRLEDKGDNCRVVRLANQSLARLLRFLAGHLAPNKGLPDWLMASGLDLLPVAVGAWRGDGAASRFSYGTVSSRWALQLRDIMAIWGHVLPSVRLEDRQGRPCYALTVTSQHDMEHFADIMAWGLPFKRKMRKQSQHWLTNMGRRGNGTLKAAYTIKEARLIENNYPYVYNLEVEGDNSYTNPFVHFHNCWDDINVCDDAFLFISKEYTAEQDIGKDGQPTGKWEITGKPRFIFRLDPVLVEFDLDQRGIPGMRHHICLIHRADLLEVPPGEGWELEWKGQCPKCGLPTYPAIYKYNESYLQGGYGTAQAKVLYLTAEEVIHWSYYTPSELYGYPPVLSIYEKALTLIGMDRYIYDYFYERKVPQGIISTVTDDPQGIESVKSELQARMQQDPHYIPWIAVSAKTGAGKTEFVRFAYTLDELNYLPVRDEIRERIAGIYGVSAIWMSSVQGIGGLNAESEQLQVMSRVVEGAQRVFQEQVFPALMQHFGITDWDMELMTPEEDSELAELQIRQSKATWAQTMQTIGFGIEYDQEKDDFTVTGTVPSMMEQQQAMTEQQQLMGEPEGPVPGGGEFPGPGGGGAPAPPAPDVGTQL